MTLNTESSDWRGFVRLCEGAGLAAVLERFCGEAQERLPAVGLSVTLLTEAGLVTAASSHPFALQLDELQYSLQEGPCVLAATEQHPVDAPDLRSTNAWPQWTPTALSAGVASVHSVALRSREPRSQGGYLGAVNLYGATPGAFAGPVVQLEVRVLGQLAGLTVDNARLYTSALSESTQLREVVASRAPSSRRKGS